MLHRSIARALIAAFFALATLTRLAADVVIDTGPSANLGSGGSHTVSASSTTLTVGEGTDVNADTGIADLLIGHTGTGSLTVSNGAAVDATAGSTFLGLGAGSSGTLTISSGGLLSTAWLGTGWHPTATASILVTGNGSALNTTFFDFGGYGGTSTTTVTSGAALTVTDGGIVERGTLTVSAGGTLTTGTAGASNVVDISTSGLELYFADSGLTRPSTATAAVTVTGHGSSWLNYGGINLATGLATDTASLTVTDQATLTTNQLTVGIDNRGSTFTASGGAQVTVANPDLGALSVVGDVLVSGAGTTLALSSAYSSGYYATLLVQAGGSFAASAGATVTVTGDSLSVDGDLTLTGPGTSLAHTASAGTASFTAALNISDGAGLSTNRTVNLSATTTISSGGSLASTFSSSTSTAANTIKGDTTVTGAGSTLSLEKALRVGGSGGVGTLTIADGAGVTSSGTTIGYGTSSSAITVNQSGHAILTGPGSTWSNTGTFTVGQFRHADLTLSAGGVLNNIGAFILGGTGSSAQPILATTIVNGAGSQLNTTGPLTLGGGTSATGNLTIADHGLVTAASTTINGGDTLTLGSFGELATAALTVNSGGSVLARDGAVFAFDLGAPAISAPYLFAAGSSFTVDPGASVYLRLERIAGFAPGTYTLMTFDPAATLTGVAAPTFHLATDFPGYAYAVNLSAAALSLTVTESPLSEAAIVPGLTGVPSAIPELPASSLGCGFAGLALLILRRPRLLPSLP